ncbi:MAG TPA: HAD domain-containing protein [Polyangiaceae bacterium]|nr:HAD domain-containing protein [Polyangiaceae bacterium]
MSHERVLFVDFDGVLVHDNYVSESAGLVWSELDMDPAAVARLDELCWRAGAAVVISSSWRRNHGLDDLRGMLARRGFRGAVVGVTPSLRPDAEGQRLARGHEIQAWLDEHPEVRDFVILDGDDDLAHLGPFHVRTSTELGLLAEHVEAALAAFAAGACRGVPVKMT